MNKIFNLAFALALAVSGLTSCSNNDEPSLGKEPGKTEYTEAARCDGTVSVKILDGSRAASTIDPTIDRLTATRCDAEDGTYTIVSYHGRNKEQIGMVQVINTKTKQVVSELYFDDSRVNYCAFYNKQGKQVAYIGVDKYDKKTNICGIVAVPMKDGKFVLDNGQNAAQLTPYFVDGVSVNCIKFIEQDKAQYANSALVVASGGNNALADNNRQAGFTKFKINPSNPTILESTGNNMLSTNYRGYWISHNIETESGVAQPVAFTYRTLDGTDLVYKLAVMKSDNVLNFFDPALPFATPDAEVEVMRRKGGEENVENFGRFSVSMFILNQGRFLVVSTGSKVLSPAEGEGGGVRVYRLDHNPSPTLTLVDVWDKTCHNTSNKNIQIKGENGKGIPYIYAACDGMGVFKLRLDYYENGKKADGTPNRYVQLVPEQKRVTSVMTESGTEASTNYVQCNLNMLKIHVAGGYEGYYTLDLKDSSFQPADPRTDLVKH